MIRELSVSRGGVSIGAAACGSNYRDRRVNLLLSSLVDGGFANVLFGLQHYARSMTDLQVHTNGARCFNKMRETNTVSSALLRDNVGL